MTKPAGNPVDAVAGLMQERQKYEAWLASLEAKRSVTPPHVFERVKADYEARLKSVYEQLMGRAAELQETLKVFTARMAKVQAEEAAKRDARYEAELRADVGELGQSEWIEMQRQWDEDMARLGRERESISHEIARLHQILAMTEGRVPEPVRTPSAGSAQQAPSHTNGASRPGAEEQFAPSARPRPGFDELAFLKSVVEPVDAAGRRVNPGAQPRSSGAPGGAVPVRAPTPAAGSAPQAPSSAPAQPPAEGGGGAPAPRPGTTDTGAVPAFLKDVPSEQTRTLKCAECGSMNFPTEWYCERCGSELAGM